MVLYYITDITRNFLSITFNILPKTFRIIHILLGFAEESSSESGPHRLFTDRYFKRFNNYSRPSETREQNRRLSPFPKNNRMIVKFCAYYRPYSQEQDVLDANMNAINNYTYPVIRNFYEKSFLIYFFSKN